ncbi:DUF1810 domain-containing protein [Siansivirga zeaxanthinifaciens]|uniref:Calpastatin n=1 Tax=Siansivirga zeaxanthinifaciens CC-SAMT-1 TaxID=1454006 RepID=A0A0C5W9J4_9FLAO|nr:DUF1810 domain-containing protein [Siansivirga zeaxanthinifaciens]AJR02987.1 calpastatin [Siansivirga zeaxanthinifaciens CC-SAMT-1]
MEDKFNLKRFIDAQSQFGTYENALNEIKNGRKSTHWMWYIFPQYQGLGKSGTSVKYAINSEAEAICYLEHPILGSRLIEITNAFLSIENKTAFEVFGSPDNLKIKSSMTLFDAIQTEITLFDAVLEKYFDGNRCKRTLSALKKQ